MGLKLGELIILLLIVMIFFGSKRLPSLGGALGDAIKNFKKGIDSNGKETVASDSKATQTQSVQKLSSESKSDKDGQGQI